MTNAYIVTGTDTGVGKTTVAAMLTLALDALYWKPIQSGTQDGTDRQRVQTLTLLPDDRFVPEKYVLSQPLSPHRASEIDEIEIVNNKIHGYGAKNFARNLAQYFSWQAGGFEPRRNYCNNLHFMHLCSVLDSFIVAMQLAGASAC